jgi:hypothetical protein
MPGPQMLCVYQRPCLRSKIRGLNGSHPVKFQTLFGNLELRSPRWNHCGCQPNPAKTFSPLSELLKEHVSPERLYLETKWASLISFELTAHLLKDALPVAETRRMTRNPSAGFSSF